MPLSSNRQLTLQNILLLMLSVKLHWGSVPAFLIPNYKVEIANIVLQKIIKSTNPQNAIKRIPCSNYK